MVKLKCSNCGNEIYFYREITLEAKIRVNKNGKVLSKIYDIVKSGEMRSPIFCDKCHNVVAKNGDIY